MTNSGETFSIGAKWALLPDGWHQSIRLEIDSVGTILRRGSLSEGPVSRMLEVIVPGMINVHSHAFQRKLVGRTQRFTKPQDDFWSWRTRMYSDVDGLTPSGQHQTALQLYGELLENGYTTVCEFHYAHGAVDRTNAEIPALMSEAVIQATKESGIRTVLLPVLYQQGGFGNRPPGKEQRPFVLDTAVFLGLMDHLFETWGDEPLLTLGYAPHSLRAVEFEALQALMDHRSANSPVSPVHIHVAEQVREVNESKLWLGQRPIEWLFDRFDPDEHWCMIHSTHATPGELKSIIDAGVTVGLCPTTEGDLGDGAFPFADFLSRGGRFGIGTDSNVCVSPAEELRFLDYQARILSRKRNAFQFDGQFGSGTRLYQMALEGGRRASALPVGRIEEGSKADLVELRTDHPLSIDRSPDEILNAYLYSAGKDLIGSVLVSGKDTVRTTS
jgi:formimidoylglutamate deiminase